MYCDGIRISAPYRGLVPYSQTDSLFFFGREKEQQIIIQNLQASRLTVMYGDSGVGKSSLLRAGVAYHLLQSAEENLEKTGKPGCAAIVFPPLKGKLKDRLSWEDPITGIEEQLELEITNLFKTKSPSEIKEQFEQAIANLLKNKSVPQSEKPSFTDILKAWIEVIRQEDENGRLFIILDQFEDYFDLLSEGVRDTFAGEFSQAVNDSKLNVNFLISIRQDALAKLDYFKGRIFRNLLDNRLAIKHLNWQSAQDAIEKPIDEYNRQQIILNSLCSSRLTVLYGDSNAGKTSVLQDGIAYYIKETAKQNLEKFGKPKFAVTIFNSWHEEQPLAKLLMQIAADIQHIGNIQPAQSGLSFIETLKEWTTLIKHEGNGKLFIILDQFEEYFSNHYQEAVTETFAEELFRAIAHPDLNVHFLICIHKNSLSQLNIFKDNIAKYCQYYLHLFLDYVSIETIEGKLLDSPTPSIKNNLVSIEKPDLVTAVLNDTKSKQAQSEVLSEERIASPYLQLIMLRLWNQEMISDPPSRQLKKKTYTDLGGAKQIVRDHLDTKLEELDIDLNIDKNTSYRLFYYLVTPSGDKLALKADDLLHYVNEESNLTEKLNFDIIHQWLTQLSQGKFRILRPLAADRYEIFLDVLADTISARLQCQRKIKEIEQMAKDALLQFESSQLEALLKVMRAGQEFQNNVRVGLLPKNCHTPHLRTALQHILDNIQEQNQFQLDGGQVFGLSFSPDGQKLAMASPDYSAYLWDLQGKPMVKFKSHKDWVWGVSFSPDGQYLATGSADCTACLWNLQGKPLVEFKGHKDSVWRVSFSSDGQILATASFDCTARLWDLQGKPLVEFAGHQDWVLSVSFSPDGQYLATASADGTARLWDLQGNPLTRFSVVDVGSVYSVSFSPDGQYLATASADGTARLWDLQGRPLAVFKGHQGWVYSVGFSPDGQRLATVSWDTTTRLWDLQGNQLALFKGHKSSVGSVSFSPDGQYLATGSWDGTARLWNLQNKPQVEFKDHQRWILRISFSPDGQHLATGSSDGTACLWDLTGKLLTVLKGGRHEVLSISFSPDGQYLATGSSDGTACLWDLQGKPLTVFKRHNNWVWSVSFSPDGQYLATGSTDGTARLWNLQGKLLMEFKSHQGLVWSVNFSPDGQYLATGSSDGTACLWDMKGNRLVIFQGHHSWVWNVSFSPNGKYLVTTSWDTTARLWDLQGNSLVIFKGHQSWLWNASFSPDGQRIATASSDGTARLWDLQGNQLAVFQGHTGIYNISFSPDGQQVAIALADGTAKVWRIEDIEQLLVRGCNWLKDYFLTHPEAREYLSICHT